MRRNLVIVRAEDTSQHETWMAGPGDRNWDLIVGYTGNAPDRFQSPHATRIDVKGPKWPALHRLIRDLPADTNDRYDYIWLPDDHLNTNMASINAMFDICAEYHLSLAQPALTPDSYVKDEITRTTPGHVLRYTNYVETMAPCFSRDFLERCVPDFAATPGGLGLESLWPTLLGDDEVAILDAVTVRNVLSFSAPKYAPMYENEEGYESAQYETEEEYRAEELEKFLAERDIAPVVPQVRRGVPDSDTAHAATRDAPLDPFWVAPDTRKRLDPSRCVILVPVADSIEPDCARALFDLEQRGYPVWRVYGASGIDQVRSQMASDALAAGYEELMWIDADMTFPADAVDQLRRLDLPISCGIYSKKGQRELVVHLSPGTERLTFGVGGGLAEIKYGATGFLLTKREVYEKIQEHEGLPTCNVQFGRPVVPYFLPMAVPFGENYWYLGEDFAFCERARRCGYKVIADTRIRLGHIGRQTYEWEDAGSTRERYSSFTFNF